MSLPQGLAECVHAGDEAGVVDICRREGIAGLRAARDEIAALCEQIRFQNWSGSWEQQSARSSAVSIAACVSSRTVVHAAAALDFPGVRPDLERLADLLVDLRPKWLPKLAARLLGRRWQEGWSLAYVLVRCGACERPDDPRYADEMIMHCFPQYEMLLADPALRADVWGLFENDTRGGLLNGRTDWITALSRLADEHVLPRAGLVDAALAALTMQAPWNRLSWYAALIDELDPSATLVREFADGYLALMRSPVSQVAAVAQRALAPLLSSGEMRPDQFLDVAAGPLVMKEKGVALTQLDLLGHISAQPQWTDQAIAAVAVAFGHRHREVQTRALRIVERHLPQISAETRQVVEQQYELLPPAARPVGMTTEQPASQSAPLLRRAAPLADAPLRDDEFVEALAALLANRPGAPMDRIIEAAYRLCGEPLEHRAALMRPLMGQRSSGWFWGALDSFARRCVLAMSGASELDGTSDADVITGLLHEVVATVARGRARPYVAMPTMTSGAIDPTTLSHRLNQRIDAGPAEVLVARLRADVDRRLIRLGDVTMSTIPDRRAASVLIPAVTLEWRGPDLHVAPPSPWEHSMASTSTWEDPESGEVRTETRHHEWLTSDRPLLSGSPRSVEVAYYLHPLYGGDERSAAWWLSMFPAYPDLGGILAMRGFRDLMDQEPSITRQNVLASLLERYTFEQPVFGDVDAVVLAAGLAAKPMSCRLAAVEAVLAVAETDPARAGLVGSWAARLVAAEAFKLVRLADAGAEVLQRSPRCARDLVLPLLGRHADHRDIHRVLDVAADVIALCGAFSLPDGIRQLASRAGTSKSVIAAQRVVALADANA